MGLRAYVQMVHAFGLDLVPVVVHGCCLILSPKLESTSPLFLLVQEVTKVIHMLPVQLDTAIERQLVVPDECILLDVTRGLGSMVVAGYEVGPDILGHKLVHRGCYPLSGKVLKDRVRPGEDWLLAVT